MILNILLNEWQLVLLMVLPKATPRKNQKPPASKEDKAGAQEDVQTDPGQLMRDLGCSHLSSLLPSPSLSAWHPTGRNTYTSWKMQKVSSPWNHYNKGGEATESLKLAHKDKEEVIILILHPCKELPKQCTASKLEKTRHFKLKRYSIWNANTYQTWEGWRNRRYKQAVRPLSSETHQGAGARVSHCSCYCYLVHEVQLPRKLLNTFLWLCWSWPLKQS